MALKHEGYRVNVKHVRYFVVIVDFWLQAMYAHLDLSSHYWHLGTPTTSTRKIHKEIYSRIIMSTASNSIPYPDVAMLHDSKSMLVTSQSRMDNLNNHGDLLGK